MTQSVKISNSQLAPARMMTGAQAVVASLEAEGVSVVFGYPGGQVVSIYDALAKSKMLRHITSRHEQGAVHEADGYARATGNVGVVLVTSGPGATNTVTGIATAYMDSIPLVVITGQVPTTMIGTDAFQESDIMGISMPVVKHSFLVKSVEALPETFRCAFHVAKTGRPGPVLIDIPSDVAAQNLEFLYPDQVDLASYKPTIKGNARQVKQATNLIAQAERPIILAGGGVIASHACSHLRNFAHQSNIPVVTTLMGKGAFPEHDSLCFGFAGMHGSRYANRALCEADVIIACGTRFSDRVTGDPKRFADGKHVIHIDIDPAEIGKIIPVEVPIVGDVSNVLEALTDRIEKQNAYPQTKEWCTHLNTLRVRYPLGIEQQVDLFGAINPETVCKKLSVRLADKKSIVTTEVGQHQMWAAQLIERSKSRTFLTSGGLGTMGYGLPAAIGASLGCPDAEVVCVAGDGSFQMNLQEMATAKVNGARVKVVIMDNHCLGMVRQLQDIYCDGKTFATNLEAIPDFVQLANAYGWQAWRVSDPDQLDGALDALLLCEGPALLDVVIPYDYAALPMVLAGSSLDEAIGVQESTSGTISAASSDTRKEGKQ